MTKKVAREIVDKTPAKLRSAFEKDNSKARKNFLGFGKSQTTSSSKLSREAFKLGQTGTATDAKFEAWLNRKNKFETLSSSFKSELRRDYWKGADAKESKATEKAEARQRKTASPPARAGGKSTAYKGKTIVERDGKFEVLGTDWNSLRDAKEYVDLHIATGGKARLKNPSWSLKQGKSQAFVYELKTGTHEADILSPGQAVESQTFSGPHSFRAATSWARLRLHEVANPKGTGRVRVFKRGKRVRNPLDQAQKQFEEFHGMPSTEVMEFREQVHVHSNTWAIGALISMVVMNDKETKTVEIFAPDPAEAKMGDVVFLSASEDGRQFIPVGGDQQINLKNLESFGITDADVRDHMFLGTIVQITYRTRKSFEKDGQEEVDFYHDLGKEGSKGICPKLIYKPRNPSMEIAGGRYQIAKSDGDLGASPGIVG